MNGAKPDKLEFEEDVNTHRELCWLSEQGRTDDCAPPSVFDKKTGALRVSTRVEEVAGYHQDTSEG